MARRQRGVILTYVDKLETLEDCVRRGNYDTVKVVTGWGLPQGWDDKTRARVVAMVPNLIVRTVSGDPSYARPFDPLSGKTLAGATGPDANYWKYDFLNPDLVEQEITPWYKLKPDIMIELGNEPNVYNQDDDFIWRWAYFLELTIKRCRQVFPHATLISPGFMMDERGKMKRFYEIGQQQIAQCDYVGVHFYEYFAFTPDQAPAIKGELRDAIQLHQQFFPDMAWYITEYGIHNTDRVPRREKGSRYARLVHGGDGWPALPINVAGAVYYHLQMKGDIHPEYHIYPDGDEAYATTLAAVGAVDEAIEILGGGVGGSTQAGARSSFAAQADELATVLTSMREQADQVDALCAQIAEAILAGGKLLTCGNGGSAADAMHLAEELVGRYRSDRRPLPAVCLNADGGAMTCIANDFGYEQIFARQVEALGQPGDVLVVFSTSGGSLNILAALRAAKTRGLITVALLGKNGGLARQLADHALVVPSHNTARIQEIHGLLLHAICEELEQRV